MHTLGEYLRKKPKSHPADMGKYTTISMTTNAHNEKNGPFVASEGTESFPASKKSRSHLFHPNGLATFVTKNKINL